MSRTVAPRKAEGRASAPAVPCTTCGEWGHDSDDPHCGICGQANPKHSEQQCLDREAERHLRAMQIEELHAAREARERATSAPTATSTVETPLLVDAPEAARLLGITEVALRGRKQRGQLPLGSVVGTGRRVQFRRDKLLPRGNR